MKSLNVNDSIYYRWIDYGKPKTLIITYKELLKLISLEKRRRAGLSIQWFAPCGNKEVILQKSDCQKSFVGWIVCRDSQEQVCEIFMDDENMRKYINIIVHYKP